MKKIFKVVFLSLSLFSSLSADWQEDYAKGLECLEKQNFLEAEAYLSSALKDSSAPDYVKIDYGYVLKNLDHYDESIRLLTEVIEKKDISAADQSKAYCIRSMAKVAKDQNDLSAMDDLRSFGKINPNMPKIERGKNCIIIKNAPKAECYRKMMTCYFIHTGQCQSKADIKRLSSGDWIITKPENSDCSCHQGPAKCDECGADLNYGVNPASVQSCKCWCDRIGLAAMAWCSKTFKKFYCQVCCQVAVYELADGCYWCCEDGDFYGKCIKPFNDILSYMSPGCEPDLEGTWD